ncbi:hypothetical protein BRE01_58760 [Brevibacillus reuszeri]|uniref:Membrane protein n=1 Tax=Brevibacillus reuszeri TaxID=54915 RepID=A0A0K9YU64_9BACL|nr:DUF2306 domain-containing protein [Brevibacillus reuszeri]KNB72221.1 membrane protein [Brevibacillus reuszeri]MED1855860.1 DUF2306 domain-containing protein [Brevibacillus reuszeri]GED72174.1 hypothetical protein BRE01_58760 [Brevibacillus reuszeri]
MGKRAVRVLVYLLAFLIGAYAVIQYGFFKPQDAGLVSIKLRNPDFHLEPWVYVMYVHIITGVLALIIGPFQLFLSKAGTTRLKWHRLMGYLYVISISISGLVNIYLSFFATGGWIAGLGFFTLDVMWVAFTWMSVYKISRKDNHAHREWMLRSYALTFAAVTLRLLLPVLLLLFHGNFIPAYQMVAWMSWVVNLVIVEVMIRSRHHHRKG